MSNTDADNLVMWIFDNKEIFNSNQYIEIMSLVQKLIVGDKNDESNEIDNEIDNIEDVDAIRLRENNYRLPESDSDMEEEAEIEEYITYNNVATLDSSSDEDVDGTTYTGAYINSY